MEYAEIQDINNYYFYSYKYLLKNLSTGDK
jgi:hypothetical protein